jgi:adenylate cyclase
MDKKQLLLMKEIERKFLVNGKINAVLTGADGKRIRQGYISDSDGKTVRVRTKGVRGFLTIKGKSSGISRTEFEYEIPVDDADALLRDFCDKTLEKTRYTVQHGGHLWEIDVFAGRLDGLIVAEIELAHEDDEFEVPEWAAEEVSHDPQYYNSNLINR